MKTPLRESVGVFFASPPTDHLTKSNDTTSVLLKLTMLQAMQPVKFSGNPSDYPTFRNRLRDNLEDGILTDSQKLEFLPKFFLGVKLMKSLKGCQAAPMM